MTLKGVILTMALVACKPSEGTAQADASTKQPAIPASTPQTIKADTLVVFSGDWVFNFGEPSLGITFDGIRKDGTASGGKQVTTGRQVKVAYFRRIADSEKDKMTKRGIKAGAAYIMEGEDPDSATFKYIRDIDSNIDSEAIAKLFGVDPNKKW